MLHAFLVAVLLGAGADVVPAIAQARLSAADEARLNAMIAQRQRVRSRLPADYQQELDRLTAHVRKQLFAAPPPRGKLLPGTTQIVRKAIPGLTTSEAASLAEYTLGGIAGGGGQDQLLNATKQMQETQMSFNMQYLQLQSQMQHENRQWTALSNIMKTKHDTVKNSIGNIR
jgi:hypothetical protein